MDGRAKFGTRYKLTNIHCSLLLSLELMCALMQRNLLHRLVFGNIKSQNLFLMFVIVKTLLQCSNFTFRAME